MLPPFASLNVFTSDEKIKSFAKILRVPIRNVFHRHVSRMQSNTVMTFSAVQDKFMSSFPSIGTGRQELPDITITVDDATELAYQRTDETHQRL